MILPDPTWDGTAVEAIADQMEESRRHAWRLQSGKVFFKHRRALYHLEAAQEIVQKMVGEMQPVSLMAGEGVVNSGYSGPLTEPLFFHLDGFLEATRAAYDALMSFLISAKVVRHDSPASINDYASLLASGSHRAKTDPPELAALLLMFWKETGQRAKEYRDCFTHHVTLSGPTWATSVAMTGTPAGWTPCVPWPDNPDARSYTKFTFDNHLDALAYCQTVSQKTDTFLRDLVAQCLVKWKVEALELNLTFTTMIELRS